VRSPSVLAHINRIDTYATDLNGRDAGKGFDDDGVVTIFDGFEFGARLVRFTTALAPELRPRFLGQDRTATEQKKTQEKNDTRGMHG